MESNLPLQNISKNGETPKSRLMDASAAANIYWTLREAALPRLEKARIIQGMFDGNPPYRRDKRKQQGKEHWANFNTLEAQAFKDSAKVPYYDLLSSSKTYYIVQTDHSNEEGLDAEAAGSVITEEFDRMLKAWPSFDANFWTMLDDFIGFNKGFFWWPRTDSWHFKRIPWHRIHFPDGTGSDPEEWELFAIEHNFPVTRLFSFIRDEEIAKRAGWNVPFTIKMIRSAVPQWKEDDPMVIQRRLRETAFDPDAMNATIPCASVFFKEFDGTWSRMLVPTFDRHQGMGDGAQPESPIERANKRMAEEEKKKMGKNDWMYFKISKYNNVQEIIAPFFYEVNEGNLNNLDGLGRRIVSIMQVKDRIRNEQANNVLLRSTILLQPQNASSQIKSGLVQMGSGVTVIPAGYQAQQSTIFGDLNGSLSVNQDLDRMLSSNTGIYRARFEKSQGNPETATEAQIRFAQSTVLTNSAVNRFHVQLDRFGHELYRRAVSKELPDINEAGIKAAKEFQKRCKDRGVTRKQLEQPLETAGIRSARAIGNGSFAMRQQMIQSLLPIAQHMGQRGFQNLLEDYTAAFANYSKVRRYFPEQDRENIPNHQHWDASRENNDMQQGAPPMLVDGQNNEVHAALHIRAADEAITSVEAGADPVSAAIFLQLAIPHTRQHIERIGRETQKNLLTQALDGIETRASVVQQAVQQMQKQQQQREQFNFDQQMKMQEMQSKLQEREVKTEQSLRHKEAKFQQDVRQNAAQHQMSMAEQAADIIEDSQTRGPTER